MMRRAQRMSPFCRRGSASVQFAVTATALFLLLLGILESSLLYWSWQALQGAAIDAGRCAALNAPSCGNPVANTTATQSYAVTAAQERGLASFTSANVTVLTGAAAQAVCGSTTATVVTVQLTYHYAAMISFVPLPSNLSARSCFPLAS
jgi:Flp pilus assembly protein TadG